MIVLLGWQVLARKQEIRPTDTPTGHSTFNWLRPAPEQPVGAGRSILPLDRSSASSQSCPLSLLAVKIGHQIKGFDGPQRVTRGVGLLERRPGPVVSGAQKALGASWPAMLIIGGNCGGGGRCDAAHDDDDLFLSCLPARWLLSRSLP